MLFLSSNVVVARQCITYARHPHSSSAFFVQHTPLMHTPTNVYVSAARRTRRTTGPPYSVLYSVLGTQCHIHHHSPMLFHSCLSPLSCPLLFTLCTFQPGTRILFWVRGSFRVRDNLALSVAMWLSTQLRMPLQVGCSRARQEEIDIQV